jgi:hypothetical protein
MIGFACPIQRRKKGYGGTGRAGIRLYQRSLRAGFRAIMLGMVISKFERLGGFI